MAKRLLPSLRVTNSFQVHVNLGGGGVLIVYCGMYKNPLNVPEVTPRQKITCETG